MPTPKLPTGRGAGRGAGRGCGSRAGTTPAATTSATSHPGRAVARVAPSPRGAPTAPKAAKFAPELVVQVPTDLHVSHGDVEQGRNERRSSVDVHDDADVEKAARHGWISGPCDCCLTIWAGLGEAIDGGAEQVVGLILLPLSGAFYYLFAWRDHSFAAWIAAPSDGDSEGRVAPPSPPSHPDWSQLAVSASAHYAQLHPVWYLTFDLGSLLVIGVVVLFEADLQRLYRRCRHRVREGAYAPLDDTVREGTSNPTFASGYLPSLPWHFVAPANAPARSLRM